MGQPVTTGHYRRAPWQGAQLEVENAEFLKGHLKDLPLADASVDVVIPN